MLRTFFLGLLLAGSARSAAEGTRPITEADRVLAIYAEDWGLGSSAAPRLILVVWGDGHAIWSEDLVRGGPPYRSGQASAERLGAVLARAEKEGAFSDDGLSRANFGPDSRFTTILLRSERKQLKMQSWHELFELDGKVVVTSSGAEPLAGRRRLEVLRREPAHYLYYRMVWSELRASAYSLIPTSSRPVAGEVLMRAGVMSWREDITTTR